MVGLDEYRSTLLQSEIKMREPCFPLQMGISFAIPKSIIVVIFTLVKSDYWINCQYQNLESSLYFE